MSNSNVHQPTALPSAVEALASLTVLQAGRVSGVVLAAQPAAGAAEVTQLQPTQAAIAPLGTIVQQATQRYAGCEVIDYQPAARPPMARSCGSIHLPCRC